MIVTQHRATRPGLGGLMALSACGAVWASCQWRTGGSRLGTEDPVASGQSHAEWPPACPHNETMCPMIYQPVKCTLRLGDAVVRSVEAGNECQALSRLKEAWCASDVESYSRATKEQGAAGYTVSCVRIDP